MAQRVTSVADVASNNHGVFVGQNVALTEDRRLGDAAITITSTESYVTCGTAHAFAGSVPYTMQGNAFVNSGQADNFPTLMSRQFTDASSIQGWALQYQVAEENFTFVRWRDGLSTGLSTASGSHLMDRWHQVTGVYNGSEMALYVDGTLAAGPTTITSLALAAGSAELRFGRNVGNASPFQGRLDDARIWDVALTAEDIAANWDREIIGNEPGLVGYWPMDKPKATYIMSSDIVSAGTIPMEDVLFATIDRSLGDAFDPLTVGVADFTLDNEVGSYSPEANMATMLNKTVEFAAQTDVGSLYPLFKGTVRSYATNPEIGRRNLLVRCVDSVDRLKEKIGLPFHLDVIASSLFTEVFSAAGFATTEWDLSPVITDEYPFAWLDDISGGEAINRINEAGAHHIWAGGDGVIYIKGRQHHAATVSVASYSNKYLQLQYALSADGVINDSRIVVDARRAATDVATVAWTELVASIPAGQSFDFFLEYLDPDTRERPTPVNSVITPVASSDYLLTDTETGSGTIVTSQFGLEFNGFAQHAEVTLTNSGSTVGYINKFQVRGIPIQRQPEYTQRTIVASSQTQFGIKIHEVQTNLIGNPLFAQNYAQWIAARWHDPIPDVSFAIKNEYPDVLERNAHDIISLVEDHLPLDGQFRIHDIRHEINAEAGLEHTVVCDVRRTPAVQFMVLDVGQLDVARLGF